ncbi:hypothetical protein SLA2020_511300 [Shorea laevis]
MNLKINKACDLSSISVLPPHARKSNTVTSGPQASYLRSQPSQQSISQGFSSQPAFFSQISQNSLDEVLTTDQRFGSQERENSAKKVSCLPQTNTKREENQLAISRSSVHLMRKWNTSEHRCQISEELEHRLGMIETSMNRFGMILDSVQNDVMQVNKGTKEVLLETDGIRQKLIAEDASLQLMNKGLEDIKTKLDEGMKSISDQLGNGMNLDKLQQIFLLVSTLPKQMEASLFKVQNELQNSLTKETQAIVGSLKTLKQNGPVAAAIPPKYTGSRDTLERKPQPLKNPAMPSKACVQSALPRKTEMRGWNSVKAEQSTFIGRPSFIPQKYIGSCDIPERKLQPLKNPAMPSKACVQSVLPPNMERGGWNSLNVEQSMFIGRSTFKKNKGKGISFSCARQEDECRVIIESDEETDEGFSCFFGEKGRDTTISLSQEAKEETDRILKRARRQKRKYSNPIIIN